MAELTPLFMDISSVYSGDELGLPYRDIIGEGVVDLAGGDLAVTEHAGTPGLSVDIAAGAAWVLGDTNPDAQPVYRVRNDAVVNLGISPDPSQPRKVIIVAQITDETFAGTGRTWALQAIHGTPGAVPTEPATPDSALKLAVIDVPAADTAITNSQITDSRTAASVGGGNLASGGGGGGGGIAIDLRNPQVASNAGNVFPNVGIGTAWEVWRWEFLKDVAGNLYGVAYIPTDATPPTNICLLLTSAASGGVARMQVFWQAMADGDPVDPASFTSETAQDVTMPATAGQVKKVTFPLSSTPPAGSMIAVRIFHDGTHANDTLAQNTLLNYAFME